MLATAPQRMTQTAVMLRALGEESAQGNKRPSGSGAAPLGAVTSDHHTVRVPLAEARVVHVPADGSSRVIA